MNEKTLSKNSWHYRMFRKMSHNTNTFGLKKGQYWATVWVGIGLVSMGSAVAIIGAVFIGAIWFDAAVRGAQIALHAIFGAAFFIIGALVAGYPISLFSNIRLRLREAFGADDPVTFKD